MDCVYTSFAEHLRHIGRQPDRFDHWLFTHLRRLVQGDSLTFGGVAPWIVSILALRHGLNVRAQHTLYNRAAYLELAHKMYPDHRLMPVIINAADFGQAVGRLEWITLRPAIYCCLFSHHAQFSTRVPYADYPVLALQLYEKKRRVS